MLHFSLSQDFLCSVEGRLPWIQNELQKKAVTVRTTGPRIELDRCQQHLLTVMLSQVTRVNPSEYTFANELVACYSKMTLYCLEVRLLQPVHRFLKNSFNPWQTLPVDFPSSCPMYILCQGGFPEQVKHHSYFQDAEHSKRKHLSSYPTRDSTFEQIRSGN